MMNEDDLFGLEAMFASTNTTVADIQAGHLSDINQLSKMDKLTTISTFAALLVEPQLQANAYRLEALVHIAVARSAGRQHPTRSSFVRFSNGSEMGFAVGLKTQRKISSPPLFTPAMEISWFSRDYVKGMDSTCSGCWTCWKIFRI